VSGGEGVLYWSRVTKRKYLSGCVVVLIIIIWNGRRRSRTRDLETMGETADYHYYIQRELLSKRDKVGILPSNLPLALTRSLLRYFALFLVPRVLSLTHSLSPPRSLSSLSLSLTLRTLYKSFRQNL